jgi:threonine dehydrogenase-like Zn-dependent dehydrogenase
VFERIKAMTGGRGPDVCIDAVGLEAHGHTLDSYVDQAKTAAFLATDRPNALRQAIHCCRKGGIVSIPGVYGGFLDKIPFGAAFQKGLTFRMGQTHVIRYMKRLLDRIEHGEIDPSFVITHRLTLDEAPRGSKIFRDKEDHCINVVLKPNGETVH